ncbi:hypothetical protein KJ940_03180, partial [Myxococcota bacterium]|nr:hypothetical protein [Myxococcota bacterium]
MSIDGSVFESYAKGSGKKACACQSRCECERIYSDPDAMWGYAPTQDRYVFGYRINAAACYVQGKDQKFDLPLYITAGTANQHDSVMMPDLISRLYRTIEASDTHKR